jgi:hypothetical protein
VFLHPLAWNGGVKPRPPSEGFVTSLKLSSASTQRTVAPPRRTAKPMLDDGVRLELRRMDERTTPDATRPSGRIVLGPT